MDEECDPNDHVAEHNHGHHHRYSHDHDIKFDVNLKCNEFKEEINQLRKRCMKALGFCSSLIGDLELAAKYTVTRGIQELLNELKASNHVLVSFINPELQMSSFQPTPNSSQSSFQQAIRTPTPPQPPLLHQQQHSASPAEQPTFMIFVPHEFSKDKTQIVRLLFLISAKDDLELSQPASENSSAGAEPTSAASKFVFNEQQQQQQQQQQSTSASATAANNSNNCSVTRKSPSGKSPVRRFSSSNSFIELNDIQRDTFLSRLSKIATNLDASNQLNQIADSDATSPTANSTQMPNAFIYSPQPYTDGYLLYVQLPKVLNGKTYYITQHCYFIPYE